MKNFERLNYLLARCALSDQKAFHELYQLTAPLLNNIVFKLVKNEAMCSDVLQEAYLQIWNNADQFTVDKGQAIGWMITIARYRALDRLSKESRQVDLSEGVESRLESSDAIPEDSMVKGEQQKALHHCLSQLNEATRQAVCMAYLQGYSREMLAGVFNTKVNTIKSWLKRGVEQLMSCINSRGIGE